MATVLLSSHDHTLSGISKPNLGTLSQLLVHPTSPVLLTKPGPLTGLAHSRIRSLRVGRETGSPETANQWLYRVDAAKPP